MASFFSTLFGGGAEREAADRNRGQLGQYTQNSLGALNRGLVTSEDALRTGVNNSGAYQAQNYDLYGNMRGAGNAILDQGMAGGLGALQGTADNYGALQAKYGAGTDLYMDSLGTRGAEGNTRATNAFQAGPGYQFTLDQGLNAINRRRAAGGMLASGNADADAITYGTGLANQTYGGWQDRLAGLINPEMAAASGQAGANANIANLYGTNAAARMGLEGAVTQGQAGANTARGVNDVALGNSLAGLYTGDATNRTGVYGNNLSGQMAQNNMQAQGESQGARNGLNAAMGLASLAMGMPPMGGSFGGLGGGSAGSGMTNNMQNFGFNPVSYRG